VAVGAFQCSQVDAADGALCRSIIGADQNGGLSVGADQAAGSISALSSLRKALARETRDRKLLAATAGNWTKVKKLLRG